jgi:solute carrier family 25 S-adenosylmethionine transporter 26
MGPIWEPLIYGGIAGLSVDVALFPIDTIKTRLQSSQGFLRSGGFKGVYRGLSVTALGSAPGAALFFAVYESTKEYTSSNSSLRPLSHMISAAIGETVRTVLLHLHDDFEHSL